MANATRKPSRFHFSRTTNTSATHGTTVTTMFRCLFVSGIVTRKVGFVVGINGIVNVAWNPTTGTTVNWV
jgi:hypothetical protein